MIGLYRYLWTGQRIEKFYELLVKEVLNSGDIEKIDTKENKQRSQQVKKALRKFFVLFTSFNAYFAGFVRF